MIDSDKQPLGTNMCFFFYLVLFFLSSILRKKNCKLCVIKTRDETEKKINESHTDTYSPEWRVAKFLGHAAIGLAFFLPNMF